MKGSDKVYIVRDWIGGLKDSTGTYYSGIGSSNGLNIFSATNQLKNSDLSDGDFVVINSNDQLGTTITSSGASDTQVTFVSKYNGKLDISELYQSGTLQRYFFKDYTAGTQHAVKIDFGSYTPALGDSFTINITPRDPIYCGTTKSIIVTYVVDTTVKDTMIANFAKLINDSVRKQDGIDFQAVGLASGGTIATSSRTQLCIVGNKVKLDQLNRLRTEINTFDVDLVGSYDESTDKSYNNWDVVAGISVGQRPDYGSLTSWTLTDDVFTAGTYSSDQPIVPVGTYEVVMDRWYNYHQNYMGVKNRTLLPIMPKPPVLTTDTFNCLTFTLEDRFKTGLGNNASKITKTVTIYYLIDSSAKQTLFETYMRRLLNLGYL